MTTMMQIFGCVLIAAVILLFTWLAALPMRRRQLALFDEKTSPSAEVRSLCMFYEPGMQAPGAAEVRDGNLIVYNVLGNITRIPLNQVVVKRILSNFFLRYLFGDGAWIGLTRFKLEDSATGNQFTIGVKDPEPWNRVFKNEEETSNV